MNILVAEDNLLNQKVIRYSLQRLGHQPSIVNNGHEFIWALEERRYDLAFLDVHMPGMGGIEAASYVVAHWPRERRPVMIALTASAKDDDEEKCRAAGMDDFLRKPIRLETLEATIAHWAGHAQSSEPEAQTRDSCANVSIEELVTNRLNALGILDDAGFVSEVLQGYVDSMETLTMALRESLAENDSNNALKRAQSLERLTNNLGLGRLPSQTDFRERLRGDRPPSDLQRIVGDLLEHCRNIRPALLSLSSRYARLDACLVEA